MDGEFSLIEVDGGVDVAGNAFSYTQLLSSRQAAAEYLRKLCGLWGGIAMSGVPPENAAFCLSTQFVVLCG